MNSSGKNGAQRNFCPAACGCYNFLGSDMNEETQDKLIFVGYTNGYQILYASEASEGEGAFYSDTDNDCYIPLYMLKNHAHRLENTTGGKVTLERIKAERKRDAG